MFHRPYRGGGGGDDKRFCSLNLLTKLMVLHHQILFSLAIVAIVEANLMWTSAEQVPSLHKVAPWYLKLDTFSSVWPFMLH